MLGKAKQKTTKVKDYRGGGKVFSDLRGNYQLYLMILVPFIYIFVFKYLPMYGAQIAFRNYRVNDGILNSEWVGLKHFIRFFSTPHCRQIIKNTFVLALYSQLVSVPIPILLAIGINYCRSGKLKKSVQMISYLPHFLSTVIIVSLISMVFSYQSGLVSNISEILTGNRIDILNKPANFKHLYVWSDVWQNTGWSSILYVSALAGVDPALHEAAMIDGASKWKRIYHIDLPCILPTVAIMLIMSMGKLLAVGFDKTFMMQNPTNLGVSEVLSTFEYKRGIAASIPDYSYPAAIGLTTSLVTFILVMVSNKLSQKLSGYGLW